MSAILHILFLFHYLFVVTLGNNEMGPGLWMVTKVEQCPDADSYEIAMRLERNIYNRTHHYFDAELCLPEAVTCAYGMFLDIYKNCDGGWKYLQSFEKNCPCELTKSYANDTWMQIRTLVDIPSDCPIPEGCYEVEKFVMNYESLPEVCMYGEFRTEAYLTKEGEKVACLILELECEKKNKI